MTKIKSSFNVSFEVDEISSSGKSSEEESQINKIKPDQLHKPEPASEKEPSRANFKVPKL